MPKKSTRYHVHDSERIGKIVDGICIGVSNPSKRINPRYVMDVDRSGTHARTQKIFSARVGERDLNSQKGSDGKFQHGKN